MKHELPQTVKIKKIIPEAEGLTSIILPVKLEATPGQFVMLWLPRVDAKPLGISYYEADSIGVTVSAVGSWSEQISKLKEGDLLGVLGPYGNGFELKGKRVVLIGGGYGAASLMPLAELAKEKELDATLIIGAKSEKYLLYRDRIEQLGIKAVFTTDDGTFGEKCYNTEVLEKILKEEKVDAVYTCGPELMEKRVAEICRENSVVSQISLERHMKCGFGVCGACCVDSSGKRICQEGPVFSGEEALEIKEFGNYHRDSSAAKHYF